MKLGEVEMLANEGSYHFLLRSRSPVNAYEETLERLLQLIRLGIVSPGERLPPERDLAKMLKVSRDTVREALGTLVEQHYIVVKRGRYGGTFVADRLSLQNNQQGRRTVISQDKIDEIVVMRNVLEVGIVRVAANREITPEERVSLEQALHDVSTASPEDFRRFDSRLHILFAELTGSKKLLHMALELRTELNDALGALPILSVNLANANRQHASIVEAIIEGRPNLAEKIMQHHVEGTDALLQGYLTSAVGQSDSKSARTKASQTF